MHSWSASAIPQLPGRGQQVRLTDSGTGELSATSLEGPATLYVCGITPYDSTHLGHANTYLGFDLLVRAWLDAGREVRYVQNVTDVDDPLLERAALIGVDWQALAAEQTDLFRNDMAALRVVPPRDFVGAVETIPLVVTAVEELLASGAAYRVDVPDGDGHGVGDVYADTSADPAFATETGLSGAEMAEFFAERGGDPDRPGKRRPLDPLLWRTERPGEPSWEGASLGAGRPGWHIECACIAREFLGLPVEVQAGGSDLVFPHHACSESHLRMLSGEDEPVTVHAHGGMVAYAGSKMSKSLGNLVLVSQLTAAGVDPMAVRLVMLAHHYREDWEYTGAQLETATERLARWRRAMRADVGPDATGLLDQVRTALATDLDAPSAIHAVDAWVAAAEYDDGAARTERDRGPGLAARTVDALLGVVV
ncbi:cysteine--1-D-myo-inosityl 2-amino-2-deoxy-alpha-D-glucopyranoside ligase [Georgenia sp. H159]|uniref:cysteine--1-D-myo-inosityl 2-amino-2-deoxy-alpha-D-glucopyranoside ligase n=1 Tax=Georgenia sp. H159 TaxID=3076115 RepID=UPI002D78CF5D|nr:cysteine--1-D-myo-inosityl 2-amino-2-deoxy-alpha-D-glucopyranoside ligase [Georgenia sp. H159]